ncbi:MAG TPA: zinc-binding dehydrogenase [Mycobacteriales bacterium]|nr:zinc-binding dehydrogenase [Mycobacteriales bacterium]
MRAGSPLGLHRVVSPAGVLPQAAWRLDPAPDLFDDEVRVEVDYLNLDAASLHQLREAHPGDGRAVREAVAAIISERGKMHNPVTGSGGMLLGRVEEVAPRSPLGLHVGQRVATLVSLTLTPLVIRDGLTRWDGRGEQVPADGHAILFGRSIAAPVPDDLCDAECLAVFDVCGAPALTARVVSARPAPRVLILGASGKSGCLSMLAARRAGAREVIAVVPDDVEAQAVRASGLADLVVVADARDPVRLATMVGEPAEVSVVCVDVPDCEGAAILATAPGGTVVFFSMATSFSAAALGAEGLAADLTMVIGNGYVPGHADLALELYRGDRGVRELINRRTSASPNPQVKVQA